MNLAVFKLFPCCLRAKHNKTRGMKMKKTTQQPRSQGLSSYRSLERENPGTERTVMSSGYSKEIECSKCYFMLFSCCSENIYSCFEKGCPTKPYATMPKGIMGSRGLRYLIEALGVSAT